MSQYRKDPLTGRWVVVAEERAGRPNQFDIEGVAADDVSLCPFCANNEDQTPRELDRIDVPDSDLWAARTVPNKYAAVGRDEQFPDYKIFQSHYGQMLDVDFPLSAYEDSFDDPIPGIGSHELIVDTPRHILCISDMSDQEVFDMFRMYRKRLLALRQGKKHAHALIFKNVGQAAGASIYHSHSQLLAMPFLPPPIQRELQRAIGFRREMDACFWCTHLAQEMENGARIIEETPHFVALCPYVSRFPAETEIYPKKHISHFETIDNDDLLWEFAQLARRMVVLLTKGVDWIKGRLAYNMILKSGPFVYSGPMNMSDISDAAFWLKKLDYSYENVYHFHLTLLPSLAKAAGFEWGCGLHINPVAPETAAKKLRQIRE
ncbi:MAG: hypothetical protein FWC43_03900 [Planctomycetaceae bacterium]|nr:hypothetical protein [Planctomycetaceae bacterium]